ncbi:hypothetical protein ACFVXE_24935 [Streptomyces sp. NPDC058231]|uniref:hypothetical protein n=1 Tax=Streptomyces sp. NPDC058231 TaxID=3346392 RepID=UPI0036F16860
MFARLSTYQGSPVPEEGDLTANWDAVLQQIQEASGFRGVFYLVDRASGRSASLTLWEDEETMQASEESAARLREKVAHREGQRVVSVERFEVGFSHVEP